VRRPTMTVRRRILKVLHIFVKIFLDLRKEGRLRKARGFEYSQRAMQKTHARRAEQLYRTAVSMGGVMIKLCQYLSARRDFLPEPYIKALSRLQDDVPAVPFPVMERIIRAEYAAVSFPFRSIDPVPLASASLGQVHRAALVTGEEVVLKILKPEVEAVIDLDCSILYHVFRLFSHLRSLRSFSDFSDLLEEFIRVTGDELDFRREVEISKRFRSALWKFDWITVPLVYDRLCTGRIIVMEHVAGVKITDRERWAGRGNDPVVVARRLIELYFEQFTEMRLLHFDPHPGNIFVQENSRLALLDYGMSGAITETMSDAVKESLRAFGRKDYGRLLEIMQDLGFLKKDADLALIQPVVEYFFEEILATVRLEREAMEKVDLSPVAGRLIQILYAQPFRLPFEWAYIGKVIGTLAGVISSLWPQINLYAELKRYVDRLARQNLIEIVRTGADFLGGFLRRSAGLPAKVDTLLERVDRGQMKFPVDFEDVDDKILKLGASAARGVGLAVSFFSAFFAYLFYVLGRPAGVVAFAVFSVAAFLYFLLYRKRTRGDVLRKMLEK
jgi:predicted unusual protein kinase regulating ubiquinone biosynthesis (AarF/ABC1/UbiB family)